MFLLKKIPLTAVALSLGIAGAFATRSFEKIADPAQMHTTNPDPEWFDYTGGSMTDPDSYTLTPGGTPTCLNGTTALCAIKTEPNGNHPDSLALQDLQQEISDEFDNPGSQPDIKLKRE